MWVKICGIRDTETARAVAALAPDAVGLNFFSGSPRRIDVATAAAIVRVLPPGVEPVGLFVNAEVAEVVEVCRSVRLGTVQLHGEESAEYLADLQRRLPDVRLLRAFRLSGREIGPVRTVLTACERLGVRLAGCLVDAHVPGAYGGTGHTVNWTSVGAQWTAEWPPLILAGGLTAENVARAIDIVRPWGVDVASGVESVPGVKDVPRVARFIAQARSAPVDPNLRQG